MSRMGLLGLVLPQKTPTKISDEKSQNIELLNRQRERDLLFYPGPLESGESKGWSMECHETPNETPRDPQRREEE